MLRSYGSNPTPTSDPFQPTVVLYNVASNVKPKRNKRGGGKSKIYSESKYTQTGRVVTFAFVFLSHHLHSSALQ